MNTQRLHLHATAADALAIFGPWLGSSTSALEVEESDGWVTLDLGSCVIDLDDLDMSTWVDLGNQVDLLFESFSTSLVRGELVFIQHGQIRRHLVTGSDTGTTVDIGKLRYEHLEPISEWSDIWTFVEDCHWRREVDR